MTILSTRSRPVPHSIRRSVLSAAVLTALIPLATPPALAAQDTAAAVVTGDLPSFQRSGASPFLGPDHWAVRAAERAEAMGLVPGYFPAQGAVPRHVVSAALAEAAWRARERGDARLLELAGGWERRFAEEFREAYAPVFLVDGELGAGAQSLEGRIAPGRRREEGEPRTRIPDVEGWTAAGRLAVIAGPLAAEVDAAAREDRLDAAQWEVAGGVGPLLVSVGERPVAYGPARSGGVVFSGAAPVERVEVQTARPLRLPGFLRAVGPVTLQTFVGRLDEARHPGGPYLWGARAAFRPHPRLTFGINRGSIFGGDSARSVTLRSVAEMVVGVLGDSSENQVVAVDGRWRLPTEGVIPLTAYLEWGADDGSGAWWDSPAIVGGLSAPALPGLPQVGVGVEGTWIADQCCGHNPWYSHVAFRGNWAHEGVPLGHPLGGPGREAMVFAHADLAGAALRLETRGFVRERIESRNLYAPDRLGESVGGEVGAALRLFRRGELRLRFAREQGDEWHQQELSAGVSVLF